MSIAMAGCDCEVCTDNRSALDLVSVKRAALERNAAAMLSWIEQCDDVQDHDATQYLKDALENYLAEIETARTEQEG